MEMNEDLIAPCGMNCGVCRFYLSRVKGLYKSKKSGMYRVHTEEHGVYYSRGL